MTPTEAYLVLNLLPEAGPIRVGRLVAHFGSPQAILTASRRELERVNGIGTELADRFANWKNLVDVEEEKRRIAEHGIQLVSWEDGDYPPALREIHDPPFLLYVKGTLFPRDTRAVAVVGSRRTTHYGLSHARKFSFQLASAGFTVVSGLARGIDTAAHHGAIEAGGRTIAVLGSGIGHVYPKENQTLADQITENGAVISEFPVLYVPDRQSFPLRNRIVAGMSLGILVVEAPSRSGALITANQALEQGRSVFAIPGPIDRPSSVGCNRLIQAGAKLVCDASDIIEDFSYGLSPQLELDFSDDSEPRQNSSPTSTTHLSSTRHQPEPEELTSLSETEKLLIAALESREKRLFDELATELNLPLPALSGALLKLEMKGWVKQLPGKYFVRQI